MTILYCKSGILYFLIGFVLCLVPFSIFAQPPTVPPTAAAEPAVYRLRSQQIQKIEEQLRSRFSKDPGFSITINPENEPGIYRVCVLASETIQREIPEVLKQFAVLLPRDGGKSLVYIEPRPVPVFQPQTAVPLSATAPPPRYAPIAMPSAPPRPVESTVSSAETVRPIPPVPIPLPSNSSQVQALPVQTPAALQAQQTPPPLSCHV
jgi:hypothetical protein